MCSKPDIKPAPAPPTPPPAPAEVKPGSENERNRTIKKKRLGKSKLTIPLGGAGKSSGGLAIPKKGQ